jgi:hypothetical protein
LQPLDRIVFGALKSEVRRPFRRHASPNLGLKRRAPDGVQDMIEAYEGLNDATLAAAWELSQADDDWADSFGDGDKGSAKRAMCTSLVSGLPEGGCANVVFASSSDPIRFGIIVYTRPVSSPRSSVTIGARFHFEQSHRRPLRT